MACALEDRSVGGNLPPRSVVADGTEKVEKYEQSIDRGVGACDCAAQLILRSARPKFVPNSYRPLVTVLLTFYRMEQEEARSCK